MAAQQRSAATLLEVDDSLLRRNLLLEATQPVLPEREELKQLLPEPSSGLITTIKPVPGMCVKTRLTDAGAKVFVNVCTCAAIPAPADLTDQELIQVLESDEPSDFRIPMSIGAPHDEKDKGGALCTAYDVVVNPTFLQKTRNNPLFHNFFIITTMEALDLKYDIQLDKNGWTVLKNKLYCGTLSEQTVRTSMPLVQELTGRSSVSGATREQPELLTARSTTKLSDTAAHKKVTLIGEDESQLVKGAAGVADGSSDQLHSDGVINKNKDKHARLLAAVSSRKVGKPETRSEDGKRRPQCVLRRVLGRPEETGATVEQMVAVTAEVHLPGISSGAGLSLLVGEERLLLEDASHYLDLSLPCSVRPAAATAHFVQDRQSLLVTVPVLVL